MVPNLAAGGGGARLKTGVGGGGGGVGVYDNNHYNDGRGYDFIHIIRYKSNIQR